MTPTDIIRVGAARFASTGQADSFRIGVEYVAHDGSRFFIVRPETLAEAQKDKARLDWLDRDDITLEFGVDGKGKPYVAIDDDNGKELACEPTIRAAVDAAMRNIDCPI